MGTAGPYAWAPHLAAGLVLVVLCIAVVGGHRRLERSSDHPIRWTRRQIGCFAGAVAASVVALGWPLADLAAHWSLTALVAQRLVVVLVVCPLLLLGLPYDLVQWLTRPAAVDAVLVRLLRPPVAVVTVTVVLVGSMAPVLVRAQASSMLARGAVDLAVAGAGLVLWLPVLGRIPGIPRPRPVVRFAYLVAQAVVPAFLSFIFIFSTRPLYPEFARSHEAIGLRALNDQQIAGFLSKLSMLLVLLITGAVVLARAPRSEEEFGPDDPLVWADVERQFERADRRGVGIREDGAAHRPAVGPGPVPGRAEPSQAGAEPSQAGAEPVEGDSPEP